MWGEYFRLDLAQPITLPMTRVLWLNAIPDVSPHYLSRLGASSEEAGLACYISKIHSCISCGTCMHIVQARTAHYICATTLMPMIIAAATVLYNAVFVGKASILILFWANITKLGMCMWLLYVVQSCRRQTLHTFSFVNYQIHSCELNIFKNNR